MYVEHVLGETSVLKTLSYDHVTRPPLCAADGCLLRDEPLVSRRACTVDLVLRSMSYRSLTFETTVRHARNAVGTAILQRT